MRDRLQLELNVEQYHEAQRAERRRLLAQLKAILRTANERGEPWYIWVLEVRRRRLGGVRPIVPPPPEDKLL